MAGVPVGQLPGLGEITLIQGKVGGEVIVLQPLGELIGGDSFMEGFGLLHAILQQQIIGEPQQVGVGDVLVVLEHLEQ